MRFEAGGVAVIGYRLAAIGSQEVRREVGRQEDRRCGRDFAGVGRGRGVEERASASIAPSRSLGGLG